MPLAKAMMEAAGNSTQPVYIEDVFSTYLYNGNGSTQTITNGIDLSTKGGLVWIKNRISTFGNHLLSDSARGLGTTVYKTLSSNLTDAQNTTTNDGVSAFNANGFSVTGSSAAANDGGSTYASWTFRKQPKFFDVVTWTGNGSARTIAHNLGSVPGCIIIKSTTAATSWAVYHTGLGNGNFLTLNSANASTASSTIWNSTSPTSTVFTIGTAGAVNDVGQTYVAYLFAHDAGGFGLTGTDNVISCGSYTGNGSATGPEINLGYEPQYVLIKNASAAYDWYVVDSARQICTDVDDKSLSPNTSAAEAGNNLIKLTATGFQLTSSAANFNASGNSYIYIVIRKPMKSPTSGSQVFDAVAYTANNTANRYIQTSFSPDMVMGRARDVTVTPTFSLIDRFFGNYYLRTGLTNAEAISTSIYESPYSSYTSVYPLAIQNGYGVGNSFSNRLNYGTDLVISYAFKRAPGFFDVVCFYSPGSNAVNPQRHNLGVAPELIILKNRNDTYQWFVGANFTASAHAFGYLNLTNSMPSGAYSTGGVFSAQPDATNFYYGNLGGFNYVAYLFASCPGVSKVGSYTGTGTTQQINCGFTGGARFVLIKRTDSTGDWYVLDSARGIVAGNDPYLLLNSTAAEVTSTDYIDTYSAGFEISSTAPAAINASGGTFIYLAIA